MKKIKAKIVNSYNRYYLSISKNIKYQINKFIQYLTIVAKKIFFFIFHLNFMKNDKVNISLFNRYLILLIVLLFSFLFYLSTPGLYNKLELQKDLTKKLKEEFNLNTALSANITYKILPTPNFEISNVLLNTNNSNSFDTYAQIKKIKIYVYVKNLHNQKKFKIKNIFFSEGNFNIDSNSFNYLNNYLKNKISNKKIKIIKSKIFFKDKNIEKDVVSLASINKAYLIYDEKKNNVKMKIEGSIFNTNYNLTLLRNFYKKNSTELIIKFRKLNTIIKNIFFKEPDKQNYFKGRSSIKFLGSEINTKYNILDGLISVTSEKSKINNENLNIKGKINTSPFFFNLDINLESLDPIKFIEGLSRIKNMLDDKILLNKNLNGKIILNIDTVKKIKFIDKAKIVLKVINGKLSFSNSELISGKIGKIIFVESNISLIDGKKVLKSKILFEIFNQKRFYQKLQIPKNKRIKLYDIYLEIEKDLNSDELNVKKLFFNKEKSKDNLNKKIDATNLVNIEEINNLKNWIELKKFSSQIFSKIYRIN